MPQPYFRIKRHGNGPFQLTPGAIEKYPALAAKLGLVTSNWAYVDAEIQLLLVPMLGARAELVAAIYRAIRSDLSRDALIQAVAERELFGVDLDLFHVIWKLGKSPNDQRNAVAHGVWGIADDIADALVMLNPLDSLESSASTEALAEKLKHATRDELATILPTITSRIPENLMVYRANDFDALNGEIIRVYRYLSRFRGLLVTQKLVGFLFPEEIVRWRDSLYNEPPIRAELDRPKGRPSNP
jgi:hypothetical protein